MLIQPTILLRVASSFSIIWFKVLTIELRKNCLDFNTLLVKLHASPSNPSLQTQTALQSDDIALQSFTFKPDCALTKTQVPFPEHLKGQLFGV
jgi:hypothetical protein